MSIRIPVSEQRRLVACWRQSELSKTAFARSHQIHPNTFWGWTRRHAAKDRAVPLDLGTFIDVTASVEVSPPVVVTPSACARSLTVRLCAPGQAPCEVGFETLPPVSWFAAVLREVASC